MKVGVDLDGVVYDFVGSLAQHLIRNRGFAPERVSLYRSWEFYLDWGMTVTEFLDECHAGADAGIIFNEGPALPGSRESLQRIVDAGHTLHVVTDRSFGQPGTSESHTARWIARELPKVQSITFTADKTVAGVDIMIDDKLQNYDDLDSIGVEVYLLDRPWNQVGKDSRRRIQTIEEYADIVVAKSLVNA